MNHLSVHTNSAAVASPVFQLDTVTTHILPTYTTTILTFNVITITHSHTVGTGKSCM